MRAVLSIGSNMDDRVELLRTVFDEFADEIVAASPVYATPPWGVTDQDEFLNAVLIVDDSGPGIAPAEREKVFERFYRAPESRSMPGSGLGLAIVKQVFDRHNATIVVEESDDGGARFRVVFPGRLPDDDSRDLASEHTSRVIPKKSYS